MAVRLQSMLHASRPRLALGLVVSVQLADHALYPLRRRAALASPPVSAAVAAVAASNSSSTSAVIYSSDVGSVALARVSLHRRHRRAKDARVVEPRLARPVRLAGGTSRSVAATITSKRLRLRSRSDSTCFRPPSRKSVLPTTSSPPA
jgi:hypothetical protein